MAKGLRTSPRAGAATAPVEPGPRPSAFEPAALRRGALVALAAVAAHATALGGGFVFDDVPLLLGGQALADGPLWRIWLTGDAPDWLPLTWTTFWIERRLFGDWAAGYHATNLALHAAASVLLWRVLVRLRVPGALVGAVLFAVHPVGVESVAWISERKNTLSGALFFGAALAWLVRSERRDPPLGVRVLPAVLFLLALLSKSAVVTLPVVLLAVERIRRGRLDRGVALGLAPLFALAAAFVPVTIWFQRANAIGDSWLPPRGLLERLGGAAWALLAYVERAVLPARLAFVHPGWPVGAESPLFWAPAVVVALAALALWRVRSTAYGRPVALALGYHALMVGPVLGLVDMSYLRVAPVSNHLQYLALAGPAALGGWAFARAARSAGPALATAVAVAVAVLLAGVSLARGTAFDDDLALWTAAVEDAPESGFARRQLALTLAERGRFGEAHEQFVRIAEGARRAADRHAARSALALQAGRFAEAAEHALAAYDAEPDPAPLAEVAHELARRGVRESIPLLERVAGARPSDEQTRYRLAAALVRQGRLLEARRWLAEALGERPESEAVAHALRQLASSPR